MLIGFSIAFESTGCRGTAGGLVPSVSEAQTSRGVRGHASLGKFLYNWTLQNAIHAFPGSELINWEGLKRH